MFYIFHHMPKCGGTSFREFLGSLFSIRYDYHVGNNVSHPKEFKEYISKPVNLEKLSENNCLIGHYNIEGIRLWQRYPELDRYNHKKFSILRDPLETAISGVKFGVKQGWYNENMTKETKEKLLLGRASYFSQTLGIEKKSDAEKVMDKYWFIAPLYKINLAAKLIALEFGKEPQPVKTLNTTSSQDLFFDKELQEKFMEKAALDRYIYNLCISRFEPISQELLATAQEKE